MRDDLVRKLPLDVLERILEMACARVQRERRWRSHRCYLGLEWLMATRPDLFGEFKKHP